MPVLAKVLIVRYCDRYVINSKRQSPIYAVSDDLFFIIAGYRFFGYRQLAGPLTAGATGAFCPGSHLVGGPRQGPLMPLSYT